jgi:phosphoglucosamine mutase
VLLNVRVQRGVDLRDHPKVRQAVRSAEQTLKDQGRVLLRPSGTEPVIRVMVEGQAEQQVRGLAEAIADTIREAAAA